MLTPAVIWAVGTMLAPGSIKYVWGSVSVSTAFISVCQQTQGPVLSAELGPLGLHVLGGRALASHTRCIHGETL